MATSKDSANQVKASVQPKGRQVQEDPEASIENALGRTEKFLYDNGKTLLIILAAVVVLVGGFMAYKYLYMPSRAEKAGEMMFAAEQNFQTEDYELALNGDGNNLGFLDVIANYGNTPQANIARHYAGVCYLHTGDLDNALTYLEQYKPTRGVPNGLVNTQNLGLRGDVYSQKGDYANAAANYEKAVAGQDDMMTTPYYLKKLGLVYMQMGRSEDAVKAFRRISEEFPGSVEGHDAEKFLGAVGQGN